MRYGHEFTCGKCGGHEFYTDPVPYRDPKRGREEHDDRVGKRHCIPCENAREQRLRERKARWEKKRPKRDRAEYRATYYRRTGR